MPKSILQKYSSEKKSVIKISEHFSHSKNGVRQIMEGVIEAASGRRADEQERVGPCFGDNRPDGSGGRFDLGFRCLRTRRQRRQGDRWTSRLHLFSHRCYSFCVCRFVFLQPFFLKIFFLLRIMSVLFYAAVTDEM